MSIQTRINGDKIKLPEHLTQSWPGSGEPQTSINDTDREAYCKDCKRRVTLSTDVVEYSEASGAEYGHNRSCAHHSSGDRS